ncbi:DUF6074 family protein [Bosea sp. MMO-172]|uniref:DUF6074 family protein n=1 Tax=Bosea sp. MMO-172 TaxID=3127885 RepID=UPI003018CB1F
MSAAIQFIAEHAVSFVFGGGNGSAARNAVVFPFPAKRRRGDITGIVAHMLALDLADGEAFLAVLEREYADHLVGKLIQQHVIDDEVSSFRGAVRAEIWNVVLRGGHS